MNISKEQQAGCCTVSFKVCRINFELIGNTFGPGKPSKYTAKYAPSAPSHKAVIKCFVRDRIQKVYHATVIHASRHE